MEFFLACNLIISLIAIFLFRYSHYSVATKLVFSVFALSCWVIPFSLIGDLLPREVALNVSWIMPEISQNISQGITQIPIAPKLIESVNWSLSFKDIFIAACVIGMLVFIFQVFRQYFQLKQIKCHPNTKLVGHHKGIPIYATSLIHNALLSGYRRPEIFINTKLVDTPYFNIAVEHEATHFRYKDNYWIAVIEIVRAIYWWNPLVRILQNQILTLIEARCDFQSSQYFAPGDYQEKLAKLMMHNLVESKLTFSAAVINKNSNIQRLKYLKEKQTMNLRSKFLIGALMISGITFMTLPISSFNAIAKNSELPTQQQDAFSLHFEQLPVEALAQLVADYYHAEAIVSEELKSQKTSLLLIEVPDELGMKTLTDATNIQWEKVDNRIILNSLSGVATNWQPAGTGNATQLNLTYQLDGDEEPVSINQPLLTVDKTPVSFHLRNYKVSARTEKLGTEQVAITLEIFETLDGQTSRISTPKLITKFDKPATVRLDGDDSSRFSLTLTPVNS